MHFKSCPNFSGISGFEGTCVIWLPKVFQSTKFELLILCIYTRNKELWNCFYGVLQESGGFNSRIRIIHWCPELRPSLQITVQPAVLQRHGVSQPFVATLWEYLYDILKQNKEIPDLAAMELHMHVLHCSAKCCLSFPKSQSWANKPLPLVTLHRLSPGLHWAWFSRESRHCAMLHTESKHPPTPPYYVSSVTHAGLSSHIKFPLSHCLFWSHLISATVKTPVEMA